MQLVIEFIIPKFAEGSTCFERQTAHHQELKNCNCSLWFYIGFLVAGRCDGSAIAAAGNQNLLELSEPVQACNGIGLLLHGGTEL